MTAWLSGMLITADRLNDNTSTQTTSGLVAATNFTVNSFLGRKVSGVTILDMYVQYTGSGISAASGNIADTQICTVPSGWRPPDQTINGIWDTGTNYGGFVIGTDGITTLRTAVTSIATNNNFRLHISFVSDNA